MKIISFLIILLVLGIVLLSGCATELVGEVSPKSTIEKCMEEKKEESSFGNNYLNNFFSVRFKENVSETAILDLIGSFNHTYRKVPSETTLFRISTNSTQGALYWVCKYKEYKIVDDTYLEQNSSASVWV